MNRLIAFILLFSPLYFFVSSNSMDRRLLDADQIVRRRIVRSEEVELANGRLIQRVAGVELWLNRNGNYDQREIQDPNRSLQSILYRNFVKSEAARTGALLLAGACIIGAEAACSNELTPWNNQTQCPAAHSPSFQTRWSAIFSGLAGATLCGGKCVQSILECCGFDPEDEQF